MLIELDGCVHAGVASVVDGVVSIGTDVADGYGCFVGRVVKIVGESCIRVGTPASEAERGGRRRARPASATRETAREPRMVTHECRTDLWDDVGQEWCGIAEVKAGCG